MVHVQFKIDNINMKKYKLSELIVIKNGRDHKDLPNGDYPVFGSGGIMRYVNSYLYDKPSVLLPRKGSLSNIQYSDTPFWTVDTLYYTEINEELVSPYYLYRYLRLLDMSRLDSGTGVPSMTFDSYYNINVFLPNIEEQRRVASILQKIDAKIALNRQINDNLEAMAKQLYDYWFVQFDFPNEEGKPYKSSGGAMVWNEKLKREIPQYWSTLPISAILDKYPTTKRYETKEYLSQGKYPIIDQGDTYIVGYTNEDDNLLTRHPAVLFGDHSTKVKFLDFDFARGADGTQILYSSNDAVSQYYLYLAVSTLQIPNPGYSRHFKYLKELPIVIPSLSIAIKFANIVKPLFKKWTNNIFNNIALTKQRNELLPLLMNGQATVNYHLSDD